MKQPDLLRDALQIALENEPNHLRYFLFLLYAGRSLRQNLDDFSLADFVFIADEISVSLPSGEVHAPSLNPSSEAVGAVAAIVWDESPTPMERWRWRAKILDHELREPDEARKRSLLAAISRLPCIINARWTT